ncbi:hypothetical protein Tco_0053038 [Tanacetum coccineum]
MGCYTGLGLPSPDFSEVVGVGVIVVVVIIVAVVVVVESFLLVKTFQFVDHLILAPECALLPDPCLWAMLHVFGTVATGRRKNTDLVHYKPVDKLDSSSVPLKLKRVDRCRENSLYLLLPVLCNIVSKLVSDGSLSADKSKITRKQSRTSKHGHENQKSTKPRPRMSDCPSLKPNPKPTFHLITKPQGQSLAIIESSFYNQVRREKENKAKCVNLAPEFHQF